VDLQSFIRETLVQIARGIEEASDELKGSGALINPENVANANQQGSVVYGQIVPKSQSTMRRHVQSVTFDVAIAASEGTGTKGGIGVVVGAIALGSQGQSSATASSTSRVQFSVPVALPETLHEL
jgi:hypothetical protein